jgi:cyanophycinase
MGDNPKGDLIIIGGHEDKDGKCVILNEVARRAHDGRLVVITAATQAPEEVGQDYTRLFKRLGVGHVDVLDVRTRDDATTDANLAKIDEAGVLFFTGGDQLRITSQIGDSPIFRCMRELYYNGATIVGTSAGAAAMPETMLIDGPSDESSAISALAMAPGLGFLPGVVIDSHFAERGRMSRLLGAVAQNPKNLGLGIDEDTAVIVRCAEHFAVLGSGAVYVLDGMEITYSSLSEKHAEGIISIFDVKLHVLGTGDRYDLRSRRPLVTEDAKQEDE